MIRLAQIKQLPDMVHACWEKGCGVRLERNVRVIRERVEVNGNVTKWHHVRDGVDIYVENPWRHGGRQGRDPV